jgi:hypothetical protein
VKVVGVTYATPEFEPYAQLLAATAARFGVSDVVIRRPGDLPTAFRLAHQSILDEPRGAGYWLWKPWAIVDQLAQLDEGDVVLWVDAAAHFTGPVTRITDVIEHHELDVWLMGHGFRESQYTKRDAFVLLDMDRPDVAASPQRFASCIGVRNTAAGRSLAAEYLAAATDRRVISDDPNTCGLENHGDFIDHRHDQSILSLLTKERGIPVIDTGLVRDGLQAPGGHVINHTRRHVAPEAVLRHLLTHGVLCFDDARRQFRTSPSSATPPR